MNELKKDIKIILNKNNVTFEKEVYLEGDLNIANLDIDVIEFVEGAKLKITYFNESEKKLYVDEKEISEKMIVKIPNEVFQVPGKIYIRLSILKDNKILQAVEEVYFYVLKKKNMKS